MQGFILPQDLKISKDLEITIASEVASTKIEIDLGVLRSSFSSSVLITTLYLHFVLSRKLSFKNGIRTELCRKFCTFIHPKLFEKHLTLFDTFIINGVPPHQLFKYKCHVPDGFSVHHSYFVLSAEMTRFLNAMLFTLKRARNLRRKPLEKLSCFNFQWKQPLYQNNLKHIVLFLTFQGLLM